MVREGLKEGLELEVGPEGIRWPLRGEFLQLSPGGFGGHRESCRTCTGRSAEFQVDAEWRPEVGARGTTRPFISVHFSYSSLTEANRKLSWAEARS